MWCWISFGLGLAVCVISVILTMVGMIGHLRPR
jgi:hypothetical protein